MVLLLFQNVANLVINYKLQVCVSKLLLDAKNVICDADNASDSLQTTGLTPV